MAAFSRCARWAIPASGRFSFPALDEGLLYKYEIAPRKGALRLKTDPYGCYFEGPPNNASVIWHVENYQWGDQAWMEQRAKTDWLKRAGAGL